MNILYVGLYNFEAKTAPVQRVLSNTKLLQDLGHTVIHLSNGKPLNGNGEMNDADHCRHYYFPSVSKVRRIVGTFFCARDIIAVIEKEPQVDAVILYNYHAAAMYRLLRYCKKRGIKVIADTTEWYQYYTPVDTLIKGTDSFFRMRIVQPKLDGIIVIGKYMETYYKKRGLPIALVPPLIDYDNEKWQVPPCAISETPSLVAIATADKHKDNLATVVQLLHILVQQQPELDFHLHVIGMSEAQYKTIFDPKGIPESMASKVTLHGRIPHDEVLKYERSAWYTIFLREQNLANNAGFPSKIAESLACGTPVITNPTSSIAEYIKNGHNGFLLDGNTAAQAEQLKKALCLDRQTVADMHAVCLEQRLFDCRKYAGEIGKVLK